MGKEREVKILVLASGKTPFSDFFASIKDVKARAAVLARLTRASAGNFGDHRVFRGIVEIRIDLGPGYRVYAGLHHDALIVLIGGGTKKDQQADIDQAVALWETNKNETERFQ